MKKYQTFNKYQSLKVYILAFDKPGIVPGKERIMDTLMVKSGI
jgi:hypothetical protein